MIRTIRELNSRFPVDEHTTIVMSNFMEVLLFLNLPDWEWLS